MAQFFAPFIVGVAVFTAISLFFMGLGTLGGMMKDKGMGDWLWKGVMWGGIAFIILTGGTASFWYVMAGLVLTYLGAAFAGM